MHFSDENEVLTSQIEDLGELLLLLKNASGFDEKSLLRAGHGGRAGEAMQTCFEAEESLLEFRSCLDEVINRLRLPQDWWESMEFDEAANQIEFLERWGSDEEGLKAQLTLITQKIF